MDHTEDLSARVLLNHILSTEQPRTPITRSASKAQSTSRRSTRLSKKDGGPQTPQDMLRRSLRQKIRESITRQSLPATKRRTTSAVLRRTNMPAATSMLCADGETPRHILMNILRTEPVQSPVIHEKAASEEPQSSSADSSITRKRPSIELSELDLPDMTIGNVVSTAKGLSRKRPRRSLNVTAFERRLKVGEDVEEENGDSGDDYSSLSLSSSTSLSLKTPFVDVQTEKKGLQRRVSNRRKISEEEFGAAVNKRQMGGASSFVQVGKSLSETACSAGFTLNLSKLSEPDITTDILHCDTALYAQPNSKISTLSIVATQDKPTVLASQLQRQMEEEDQMVADHSKLGGQKSVYLFPTEEEAEPQDEEWFSRLQEDANASESQKEKEKSTAHGDLEDAATVSEEEEGIAGTFIKDDAAESEEEENREEAQIEYEGGVDSHTEDVAATTSQSEEGKTAEDSQTEGDDAVECQAEQEEDAVDLQSGEDVTARSQSEDEEVVAARSQSEDEEDVAARSQSEDEEDVAAMSQSEDEEVVAARSQSEDVEDVAARSQSEDEEDVAARSQSEDEENVAARSQSEDEEDVAARSQSEDEEDVAPRSQSEDEEDVAPRSQSEDEEDVAEYQSDKDLADSQPEDEHDGQPEEDDEEQTSEQPESDLEHVSRRAHRSEGGLVRVTETGGDLTDAAEAGWTDGKSKVHSSLEIRRQESSQHPIGIPDLAKSSSRGQMDASYREAETDADEKNSLLQATFDIINSDQLNDDSPEEAAAASDLAEEEEEWEDEESDAIPSKTPAFVRQKISFFKPQASPSVFKNLQPSSNTGEALPKPKQVRQKRKGPAKKEADLPKSYLMNVFKHFAKTKVSPDVYPVLKDIMNKYFDRLAEDLETYAVHAKRKTIEVEDAELLLKRQGYVNDKVSVEVLIEKYLRMDQRKLLIPIATKGNVVIPEKRR